MKKYTPFIFEENFCSLDLEKQKSRLERKIDSLLPWNIALRKSRKSKIEDISEFEKNSQEWFHHLSEFFSRTRNQEDRKVELIDYFYTFVRIEGEGSETILLEEAPQYYLSKDKKGKFTRMKVRVGDESTKLILYDQPQMQVLPYEQFELSYKFRANFHIKKYEFRKTGNPMKTWSMADFFDDNNLDIKYMHKKNDKFVLRVGDGPFSELQDSLETRDSEHFSMQCRVFSKDNRELFYQGSCDCVGNYFPFFVYKRDDRRGDREKKIVPEKPQGILV